MKKLQLLIIELEQRIPHIDKISTPVSAASVGWHLQHCVLVAKRVLKSVENSDPADYKPVFNFKKLLVFSMNKIPRGKAKAPGAVIPTNEIIAANLQQELAGLKESINILTQLKPNNHFDHPVFGHLNVKGTIKMMKIHTKHHLDIIDDIIKHS